MCTRATLAEVRQLQKLAGILKEGIDYSLDEMLNEQRQLLMEKSPPCWYLQDHGLNGPRIYLVKWMVDGDPAGHYQCRRPGDIPHAREHLRLASKDETDWTKIPSGFEGYWESLQEDAVPKPTAPLTCEPGHTSYSAGDPKGIICLPSNKVPKSINGKPPKKIASAIKPKPGMQK